MKKLLIGMFAFALTLSLINIVYASDNGWSDVSDDAGWAEKDLRTNGDDNGWDEAVEIASDDAGWNDQITNSGSVLGLVSIKDDNGWSEDII